MCGLHPSIPMLYGVQFKTSARLPISNLAAMLMEPDDCDGNPESPDPVDFVQALYAAAHRCLTEAVAELQSGEISARARAIARTEEIVRELSRSLDRQQHGDLARNLEELYEYMLDRLADAHIGQYREPLLEVKNLLNALTEEWEIPESLPEAAEPDLPPYLQEEPDQEFIDYDPEPSIEYAGWPKTPD